MLFVIEKDHGQLNMLEMNEKLILMSYQIKADNMKMNINEVFYPAKRMIVPHLLVKDYQATIIRVLNGDDIHLLDNLFRLYQVVKDNI